MSWARMPSLSALRAFDVVVRSGGFAAAAAELHVTEAAVRQQVRALERHLGIALLQRQGRAMRATDAGRLLAGHTAEAFDRLHTGVRALQEPGDNRPVRIALPPAFAEVWLMPRLGEFWARWPEIPLELLPGLALVDLAAGDIDLAIRYGHGDWPGCSSEPLASADYAVVARADHKACKPIAAGNNKALAALPWLFEAGRDEHRRWANSHGIDFDGPEVRHFPTNSLVLSALRAGQGVSLQAYALVERDIDSGLLGVIATEAPPDNLGYYLVTATEVPRPAVRQVMQWLRGQVGRVRRAR